MSNYSSFDQPIKNGKYLDEYEDDQVDQVIDEQSDVSAYNIDDVLVRFEQAKLYSTLLKHNLFSQGSADQTTVDLVENEIKQFVVKRMRVLMGVEADTVTQSSVKVELPFSDVEIQALKSIASRLIDKQKDKPEQQAEPMLNQVSIAKEQSSYTVRLPEVTINPDVLPRTYRPEHKPTPQASPEKLPATKGRKPKTVVIKEPTPEEGNRGSDGTNYAQAVPGAGRMPMPTQDQMNRHAALSVQDSSLKLSSGAGGSLGDLLNKAITVSLEKRKGIVEEE